MPEFEAQCTPPDLDDFTRGYFEAAEWLCFGSDGNEPDRASLKRFAPQAIEEGKRDCAEFQATNAANLSAYYNTGKTQARAGHNFYLDRCGHGAGFTDDGIDKCFRELKKAARFYSDASCVAFDGIIEFMS